MAVDRDKVLRAAQKFVEGKRWDKAIAEFQRLIAEDPKDVRVLLKIGDCHLKIEQYAEAIETYEVVARLYIEQKPPEPLKAIRVYRQILEIIDKRAPKLLERFGWVLPRLAELYTQLGLTSDAAATYDDIANRLHKANKDREAIEPLKKVVDLDPQNPVPRLRLAEAYSRIKDTPAAIGQLGQAAEVLVKIGRRDDAMKVLDRLLAIKPDGKYAKVAARMYLERAQQTDAMTALAKLQISFKENPKDLETLGLLAKAFDKLGQGPKATEVLKEAARLAKEAKKNDEFNELVDALLARAPNDDAVRQLAAQRPAPPRKQVEDDSVIVVGDDYVDVDDLPPDSEPPIPLQPSHHDDEALRARQYMQRAEAYRSQYDYPSAIAILLDAVAMVPTSHELRSRLVDVLKEAGDEEGAIRQMLIFAQRLSVEGDVKRAAELLDEILLMDASQPEAIQMLRALGYQVDAPQPQQVYPQQAYPYAQPQGQLGALDDPFAGVQAQQHQAYAQQPQYPAQPYAPPQHPPAPTRSQTGHTLDEDVLEQIDFYANQGMLDDARAMLDEQLALLPNHPLLLYKRAELEQMGRPSYVPDLPGGGSGIITKKSEYPADNDFKEIQDMINDLEFAPEAAAAPPEFPGVNVEKIFDEFKQGVQAQISDADSATHYDLGVAYREMGMYMDAIHEFEVAARDPSRECVCRSVIGMIHLQLGNVDAAIDAFLRGLEARQKTREQELALAYELADAYEARKNPEQALYYFKRVGQIDPNYREPRGGVQDRIRRLEPNPVPAKQAKAAGAELLGDDFDLAFDDLVSKGKLS
ncbi:tetratricopeptide repeat protein [Polyangium sorediatum]|uniref:Tetratricopeptide repeat protein n=1 Tax=Polyangium sorediatum TaxID=889274 RepID=A0ABT6NIC5_9BACT|nr:tetratricopeptide repeat protein [Polyangium sorediatum]MDI1428056.1 tetratricopeptide repeat protein [Polyangium sorediatum]